MGDVRGAATEAVPLGEGSCRPMLLLLAGLAAPLSSPPRSALACCALVRRVAGGESSSDT